MLRAIENGAWSLNLQMRLDDLERSKAGLASQLEAETATPFKVVRLHPDMAELYQERLAALERALWEPEMRQKASEALQALIERVVLTPARPVADRAGGRHRHHLDTGGWRHRARPACEARTAAPVSRMGPVGTSALPSSLVCGDRI